MSVKTILILIFVYACGFPAAAQKSHSLFHSISRDSVVTYASKKYEIHSFLRKLLMGKNYREEWRQPVTLPVFRFSETDFTITELGGGMQTKSLKLEDSRGRSWALRTVDKDVTKAIPPALRESFVKDLSQDHISAAMPYGAPVVGALAKSAHVLAAQPTIYFVADDTALGEYRSIFANTVCMLVERDVGFEDTEETETVLRKIQADNSYVVDQKALLQARLLDMLVADWDRHADNWRWGIRDSAGLHFYHAVPRDRDWAFYHSNGLVPRLVKFSTLRFLVNFGKKPEHIRQLSYKALVFDGMFLNGLSEEDWKAGIHRFQNALTDEAIEQAVQKLPPAIFAMDGASFIQALKSRRDGLEKPVLSYYRFLAKKVQIDGSAGNELFSITPADGGFLLQIYKLNETGEQRLQKMYERRFLRSETYRVTINGLGGNDRFETTEEVATDIRLTLNGGTGSDSYDLKGNVRTEVHDTKSEANRITHQTGAKIYLQ